MEEVLFITDKGNEIFLPEKTGNALGFERAKTFSPPEISKQAGAGKLATDRESEVDHAAAVLFGVISNGFDGASEKERQSIFNLAVAMEKNEFVHFDSEGVGAGTDLTGQEEQTSGPSLIEFIGQLEAKMDGDTKISKTGREAVGKHIQDLLSATPDAMPLADPASTSTTNPKEGDEPGKSN